MKTGLFKYIENFTTKNWKFSDKNSDIFFIFLLKTYIVGTHLNCLAQAVLTSNHNLYFLSRNKKNNVYPCKPLFYYIKVGFKGVKII